MIDQKHLAKLLGMLGSSHDGECLNAARAAQSLVVKAGLTWSQVLEGGGYNEDFVQRVAAQSYAAGKADAAPRKTFASYSQHLLDLHPNDNLFSSWEKDFLSSWTKKHRWSPTPKQLAIFTRLSILTGVPLPPLPEEESPLHDI